MITLVRTATAANGKFPEVMAFALKVRDYLTEKHGYEMTVHRQIGGDPFRLVWASRFESLAALEATQPKIMADEGYMSLLQEAGDLFNAGSLSDTLLSSL